MKTTRSKILLGLLLSLVLLKATGCVGTAYINGSSMYPSLQNGDLYIEVSTSNPDREDIIVFVQGEKTLVKRVIGVPGDKVSFDWKIVYVNGAPLEEPYIVLRSNNTGQEPVVLKEDEFYVMGDNRPDSNDSRAFGPVPRKNIKGKLVWRLWRL